MIEADCLSKHYGQLAAVDQVSFKVAKGEVLGFLGPNGAGKSTTMRMLTGFLVPSQGSARIGGYDSIKQPMKSKALVGYLPEGAPGYGEMTVHEFLSFIAAVRGLKRNERIKHIAQVVEQLQLEAVLYQTLETLSKGFRRRVGLAQAILHDPQVLILDEPTDGLDPNQKHEVRLLIQKLAQSNKAIVISTHILEEVEALCSRALIIAQGRIVADDTPQGLQQRSRYHNAISLISPDYHAIAEAIRELPKVVDVEILAQKSQVTIVPEKGALILDDVEAWLREHAWSITSIYRETGRLDDVFRQITAGVRT